MRTFLIILGLTILAFAVMQTETIAAEEQKAVSTDTAVKEKVPETTEAVKKSDNYEYTGASRRDPFTSLILKKSAGKVKGRTPLESYETTEMKLIAIMWANNKYYAVVSLPDSKSYTVYAGLKVGMNAGVIKKITKDTMIIADRIKDVRGRFSPKERVLKLRTEEE
jgi:Tfp pilus assembly protein PilP